MHGDNLTPLPSLIISLCLTALPMLRILLSSQSPLSSGNSWTARAVRRSLHLLDLWQATETHPQVDQRLHRLRILIVNKVEHPADVDEVHKASIQLTVTVSLPEEHPVLPEQVGVAAEHLLVHVANLCLEALWEAGCLAEPVIWVGGLLRRRRGRWGGSEAVGREQRLVLDLAVDPGLDVLDVGRGRKIDWVTVSVDPGVRCPVRIDGQ